MNNFFIYILAQVRFLRHLRGDVPGDIADPAPGVGRLLHPPDCIRHGLLHAPQHRGTNSCVICKPYEQGHSFEFTAFGNEV